MSQINVAHVGGRIRKMNRTEQEMWARGIHRACGRDWVPALRSAFAHLMPFVDENCPTAYTDCQYRIGLSPDLLNAEKTTDEQLAMVIIHETMHNTQHHRQRLLEKKGMNGRLGNFVTDLEINSIIAEGIFSIDLERAPSASNGHWEWLLGEVKELSEEEAENYNKLVNDPNHTYKKGELVYQGGLLPRNGQFYDCPPNKTAEQYLEMFDYEEEEMTWEQFMEQYNQQSGASNSNGSNGDDGNTCPVCGGQMNQNSSDGNDEDNGSDDSDGNSADADENSDNGSGGNDGANSGSDGSNEDGNTQGQENAPDTGDHKCPHCGNPVDGNGQAEEQGNGNGSGNGNGGGINGNARTTVTKIYKKRADGSREEVGQDVWVDRIDIDPSDDVWKQASDLGIDPITRGEEQRVKEQIAHDIEEQRRTNGYGSGAGNMLLDYVARGLRPPVVDWKKMLRRVASRACAQKIKGRDDFTWQRLSRRYSQGKYMFPGMMSYVPTIRFAIDTSGSMSKNEYHKALSEAEGILRYSRAKIEVVCVDYVASQIRTVSSVKEITDEMVGGGGTDMGAALRQVAEQKPKERPDVLVIATDGCYDWDAFARQLSAPELKKTVVIVLLVYKFDEDRYFAEQGSVDSYQSLVRKYHKDAKIVQAWV